MFSPLGDCFSVLLVQSCSSHLERHTVCRCTNGFVTSTSFKPETNGFMQFQSYPSNITETFFLVNFHQHFRYLSISLFFSNSTKITTLHKANFRHDVACSAHLCCLPTSSTFTILAKCQMGWGPDPTVEGTTRGHCTVQVASGNEFLCACACWKLGGEIIAFLARL